jgi:hypothetical protein
MVVVRPHFSGTSEIALLEFQSMLTHFTANKRSRRTRLQPLRRFFPLMSKGKMVISKSNTEFYKNGADNGAEARPGEIGTRRHFRSGTNAGN